MPIPDYRDLKMNMSGLNKFFNDQGIKISSEESSKLNTIFNECDTENAKGEKKPDGELTGQERSKFLARIKSAAPKLYQKVVDFYTAVDVAEDLQKTQEETKKDLEKTQNESKAENTGEKIKNSMKQFGLE